MQTDEEMVIFNVIVLHFVDGNCQRFLHIKFPLHLQNAVHVSATFVHEHMAALQQTYMNS